MLVSVSEENVCIEYNNSSRIAVILTNNYFFAGQKSRRWLPYGGFFKIHFDARNINSYAQNTLKSICFFTLVITQKAMVLVTSIQYRTAF